jgi:hypothetical protein
MGAPRASRAGSGDRRAAAVLAGVLVIGAVVVLVGQSVAGALWYETYDPTPVVDCDRVPPLRETWRRANATDDEMLRRKVAAYIIDCDALRGRSRRAVRSILGRPGEADRREMWFYLGPDGLSIDSEGLVVRFGRDGRVGGAEVAQG